MQKTITIQETPFPSKEEITLGAIELGLGILAMIIIAVLIKKLSDWQNKYVELYNSMVGDITDLQRKVKARDVKIDNLEKVIHNLKKSANI